MDPHNFITLVLMPHYGMSFYMQCWCWSHWYADHHPVHDEDDRTREKSGHLQFCSQHETPEKPHGSDRGKEKHNQKLIQ